MAIETIIFMTDEFDFPITLLKLNDDEFRVVYGKEVKEGDYTQSCFNLGKVMMHAANMLEQP